MEKLIIEDNIKNWLSTITNSTENELISNNWKDNFKRFSDILRGAFSDLEIKIDWFIFLNKIIVMKFVAFDTEIKSYFNDIVPILFSYSTNSNPVLAKYSIRLIKTLIDFNENMEFILKYAIKVSIDGIDWQERYSGVIILKLFCENKKDFWVENKNYCKKVIESLIFGYKNCSEVIRQESVNTLTEFIAKLPNYTEITKWLPSEMLNRIYKMQSQTSTSLKSQAGEWINKSITIWSNPLISVNAPEEGNIHWDTTPEIIQQNTPWFVDASGNIFGIFPSELINEINNIDTGLPRKIELFNRLLDIFNESSKESVFWRFASTFFKYLSHFLSDKSVSICWITLKIMNEMVNGISGVNLIASFYTSIPLIINTFDNQNVNLRQVTFTLLTKIVMIVPTSQVLPYVINAISKHYDSWTLLHECLTFIEYVFTHWNEVYNDIEWAGQNANYDINIFWEVWKWFDHPVGKIVVQAKKVIKFFGDKCSGNKSKFIISLSYYVNHELEMEINALFNGTKIVRSNQRYDIATQRVLSAWGPKITTNAAEERNNEIWFDKVKRYEKLREYDENNKLNVEENLMEDLLDKEGRIIKIDQKPPGENYPNYDIEKPEPDKHGKSKWDKTIYKSRLKRYNDPKETDWNEIYDRSYSYEIHNINELDPLDAKKPVVINIYYSIVDSLKNKLNWEKQFKAVDSIRKIIAYHREIIKGNVGYYTQIISSLLEVSCSTRSLLARNALVALSELFEVETFNIKSSYDNICRIWIKKMQDSNTVLKEEAIKAMISLIMFGSIEAWTGELIQGYTQTKTSEIVCILIMCFGFFLKYHRYKVFHHVNWNKMMVYVTEQFNLKRNVRSIREACVDFYFVVMKFFNNGEKFENYLKIYFSMETMNSLLFLLKNVRD